MPAPPVVRAFCPRPETPSHGQSGQYWASRPHLATRHPTDRACWVLWDPEERVVEFRKTEYSRLQAELDMVRAGLPVEAVGRLLTGGEIALLES